MVGFPTLTCTGTARCPAGRMGTPSSASFHSAASAVPVRFRGSLLSPPRPYMGTTWQLRDMTTEPRDLRIDTTGSVLLAKNNAVILLHRCKPAQPKSETSTLESRIGQRTFSWSMPALQTGQTWQLFCTCIHLRTAFAILPRRGMRYGALRRGAGGAHRNALLDRTCIYMASNTNARTV